MFRVVANGENGTPLATVTLPISDSSDRLVFSSGLSDPPVCETAYAALYENEYGKGRAIYSAGCIERDPFSDNQKLFTRLICDLVGEFRARIDAPSCVDYTVYEKDGVYKVYLLNHQTESPPIRISDVKVSIRVGDKEIRKVLDVTGGNTAWHVADGVLSLSTDLDTFKLLVIETQSPRDADVVKNAVRR
jgi:hypothetical protein